MCNGEVAYYHTDNDNFLKIHVTDTESNTNLINILYWWNTRYQICCVNTLINVFLIFCTGNLSRITKILSFNDTYLKQG